VAPGSVQTEPGAEINRGYLHHIRAWSGAQARSRWTALKNRLFFGNELRAALFPLALLAGLLLLLALRRARSRGRGPIASPVHRQALAHLDAFIRQYPLHLYPILAKALELAYLKERLAAEAAGDSCVLEVGIGEGTLSARLFGGGLRVTGIDLNPYSLLKASTLPHVARAIVGDGLDPPIHPGTFDLLLSVNFLHHVSQKEAVIANWARVAAVLLFNENTPFWASGWTVPYLLRHLGLRTLAARRARAVHRTGEEHEPGCNHRDALEDA